MSKAAGHRGRRRRDGGEGGEQQRRTSILVACVETEATAAGHRGRSWSWRRGRRAATAVLGRLHRGRGEGGEPLSRGEGGEPQLRFSAALRPESRPPARLRRRAAAVDLGRQRRLGDRCEGSGLKISWTSKHEDQFRLNFRCCILCERITYWRSEMCWKYRLDCRIDNFIT